MTNTNDQSVRNIYPDEQDKLDSEHEMQVELWLKIQELLTEYGYAIEARLVEGMPTIELVKA